MTALDNKQLVNLIRYAPVVVVFVFALAFNLIAIQHNREQAAQSIQNLREELTIERKEAIRSEIHQVYNHLHLEKSKIENDLKAKTKQRVYEAYGTANYIYTQNTGKPKAEISRLISEALRSMRFFNGRGYFFIIDSDGTFIMNAANANLEGQKSLHLQGDDGQLIMQNFLDVTKNRGEGFIHWRFKKPKSDSDKAFNKIGYIKKFEPYNWSIATGEYLSDFESDVQKKLLKWLAEYEYGEHGYFFVLDKKGELLAHHANDFLGVDFVIGENVNDQLLNDVKTQISNGGGYIRHAKPLTLSGTATIDQVSYVKEFKEWDWIIGTGFSSQFFEKNLRLKQEKIVALNQQSLTRLIYLTIGSLLLLTGASLYVGHLIANRFSKFQNQIKDDFNELNNTKNKMEYMALHDALTGLPNRVLMLQHIEENIESANAEKEKLAVMFVDLDNFKNVNDLHGHYVGDLLLKAVSHRFKAWTDFCGSVSRFGGDEFVFCFANLKDKKEAEDKAKRIHKSLLRPMIIDGKSFSIACSIGVSIYPEDGSSAETLIGRADTVLYKSKADKKGQILFYSNTISEQLKRKVEVEHALASAIEREELTVCYQPQIRTKDEKLVSVEALARWEHPVLGHVFPDEFIPIAEETGMIHAMDMLIFKIACEEIVALSPNGKEALKLSVNISPVELMEPNLSSHLLDTCNTVGIEPERITLEITENIFIHGFDTVQPVLNELRQQGFGLSLDDFGTGYSSLSYINSLPLTEIKIDRSFTNKFINNYQSDMLVRMIVSIGRLCSLVVIAEGVETKPQFKKLVNYGCDSVQGYYFDRPLTIERLSEKVIYQQGTPIKVANNGKESNS